MLNYTLGTIEASEALIKDLYIDLRAKVNAWSKITQQTPQARMGYVGQHLVSVVTGYPGGKSGARGYDLVIDDYLNIRSQSTSKAPFNMWPHMLKFALTEPTLIYRSKITNDGNIITDVFPSKNNTYSDVLLPLSSYSGSTTISVANIKNVIKKYSPSARVNGLNKEKLLQLLEDIRKTNNITNADLCNKFADEIYLPKIVLKKADIPLLAKTKYCSYFTLSTLAI